MTIGIKEILRKDNQYTSRAVSVNFSNILIWIIVIGKGEGTSQIVALTAGFSLEVCFSPIVAYELSSLNIAGHHQVTE